MDRAALEPNQLQFKDEVARLLLLCGVGVPQAAARPAGSRCVLFEASDNNEAMLAAPNGLLQSMADVVGRLEAIGSSALVARQGSKHGAVA